MLKSNDMTSIQVSNEASFVSTSKEDFIEYARSHNFSDLHFKIDHQTGMIAIVAIHSTALGPALGGCRFIEYPDTESAILDAMRLARGMSYKAASVNLPIGGGKAVIIKPNTPFDREGYMHAFGHFVDELGGRYITALDSGTQLSDMDVIAQHTMHVASLSRQNGEPSPFTAKGVLKGIEAAIEFKLGKKQLKGLHVAIEGVGHVGYHLANLLHQLGAQITIADINQLSIERAVKAFGAQVVPPQKIHQVPCDVFAPCALGASINDETIDQLQTPIIAGAANNQLAHGYHGQRLHDKGILYATDYVINAGGLIYAASKYFNTPEDQVTQRIATIGSSLLEIFQRSQQENRPTSEIADKLAEEKLGLT